MKKILITLICTLFILLQFAKAQNYNEILDRKKGFNKFILESSFQIYKSDVKIDMIGFDNVKFYTYIKNDVKSVFGINIKKISLGFFEDKLYTINIDFGNITDDNISQIDNKLEELFGDPILSKPNHLSTQKFKSNAAWTGQIVWLQRDTYSCSNEYSPCETNIFLISKKLQQLIKEKSF